MVDSVESMMTHGLANLNGSTISSRNVVLYRHTSDNGWNPNKKGHNPLIRSQLNKKFTEITVMRGMKFDQVVTEDSEKKSVSIFRTA